MVTTLMKAGSVIDNKEYFEKFAIHYAQLRRDDSRITDDILKWSSKQNLSVSAATQKIID
uniref:Uncharacterized protein n=1 Tax=Romanomermis culicivorax TaxID=13658 RepID=A0A915L812_ROMCU